MIWIKKEYTKIGIQALNIFGFNLFSKEKIYNIKFPIGCKSKPIAMISPRMNNFKGRMIITDLTKNHCVVKIINPRFGINKFSVCILGV